MTHICHPVAQAQEMILRCHECASGLRAIGRDFSAAMVEGFARDIEGGAPWQLYIHWLREAEERLEGFSI